MLRSAPPLKLARSPLIFVLAQVKISPVMAIEEKIPGLQESLRKNGFPRLAVREIQTHLHAPDRQPKLTDARQQWEFINRDASASVMIDAESFNYQVSRYDVFETFSEGVCEALEQFARHIEPDLVQRRAVGRKGDQSLLQRLPARVPDRCRR
jgi:uncharacterized protein (TIGR04255 family)